MGSTALPSPTNGYDHPEPLHGTGLPSTAKETFAKRDRGLSTNGAPPGASQSQRLFRALPARPVEEHNVIDQGTVRGIASARAHGRQTSHMSEPRFSPAHSPDETANTSPAISPTLPISSTSSAVQYTSDSASHSNPDGTNGSSAATRSSVGSSILRRVATAESFDTSFGGSAVVGDMSAKSEGRSGRLNTHSVKKDGASRSLSRRPSNLPPDLQTVGDFAQEHLFTSFVNQADHKISQCTVASRLQIDFHIDEVCGPGVDPSFDQMLSALGYVARARPKPLIERLIQWREVHAKRGGASRSELSQVRSNTSSVMGGTANGSNGAASTFSNLATNPSIHQSEIVLSERRSAVATYLFCRVLIDVLGQTDLQSLTSPLVERLEDLTYTAQLRAITYQVLDRFPMKRAQWDILNHLLGVLSALDFEGVSGRFVADLKTFQKDLGVKAYTNKPTEAEAAHLLKSMRHLRLQLDSEKAWARSCAFMHSVAELFAGVHGQPAKMAYCKMVGAILLPCADKINTNFDQAQWRKVVVIFNDRLTQLLNKPKYWQIAFPVQATLACVSPYDIFTSKWQGLLSILPSRLRERHNRGTALKVTCRLVWSYLQRTRDSLEAVAKTLEEIVRVVFFSGKRYSLSTEPAIAEPLIQLIRIIGFKNHDICFKTIIFPLLNYETISNRDVKDLKIEQLDPDKTIIGIRAFLAIMADLESKDAPRFPVAFDDERLEEHSHEQAPKSATLPSMQSRSSYSFKQERLSKPVMTGGFSDATKTYYVGFSRLLAKIAVVCDDVFGGQAVMDEKLPPTVPKTPIAEAWNLHKREDNLNGAEDRSAYFELLRVTIQALPRVMLGQPTLNPLLNLLCTGTAHVEREVARCSAKSLQSIARQGHAQLVIERFSGFIINYDNRCFASMDNNRAGANHLESALRLYVELLHVWREELQEKKTKTGLNPLSESASGNRNGHFDASSTWTQIDRVESQGLLFLCAPSHRIRAFAVEILSLVAKMDATLGQTHIRISTTLEEISGAVLASQDETLSSWERSRLERGMRQSSTQSTLVDLCCSGEELDGHLWLKLFPTLIRATFEACPVAVTQTREDVCSRLSQMHGIVELLDDRYRLQQQPSSFEGVPLRAPRTFTSPTGEVTIAQWRLYLMFACTTLTRTGGSQHPALPEPNHVRKISKSSQGTQEAISTATDLFLKVIPLLSASTPNIREAAVVGLGSININLYKPLLESLDWASRQPGDDLKKQQATHQRVTSSPRRTQTNNRFQPEIVQVYKLTSHFLQTQDAVNNEWILEHISSYTKALAMFLRGIDSPWEHQALRIGYCGLVEGLYLGISRTNDSARWMNFQNRRAAFSLMEEWCGHASTGEYARTRNLEHSPPQLELGGGTVRAQENNKLRNAALNAMATLCSGPIRLVAGNTVHQFDTRRMLQWIHSMFRTESDKTHATGRRALKNVITHNLNFPVLLENSIDKLYVAENAKGLESYIEVISVILMGERAPIIPFWKIFSALLFILGNEKSDIRRKSARLLRFLDERERKGSKLQDLDISISDKTTAVNKKAQFEISQRLALQHSEHAFSVFSEFSKHFNQLHADHKRNIVLALLPWIKTIELQLDPSGGPTASSYMLLVNLLKMTIDHSTTLHHEIQALWQALATGPHAGNVKLILDCMIDLCLERRDEKLVQVAKQVVVFLSSTPAGQKVIESLLLEIGPRNMWEEKGRAVHQPSGAKDFPYLADLTNTSPESGSLSNMSLGHLCLILLVDLIVAPITLPVDRMTLLLHVVLILWDHRMDVVQEQAREMLVHLIHELVISKMDEAALHSKLAPVEDFIELIRRRDSKVIWSYEDNNGRDSGFELKAPMVHVVGEVVRIFSITYPGIQAAWGTITMDWATHCPVRHLACRSLQIYRCILTPLDQKVIVELLHRLSTSVADEENITQTYSMDIMRTVRTIIEAIPPTNIQLLPQLFWTTCACLDSVNELEFLESLAMLEGLLGRFDLGDITIVSLLAESKPAGFDWPADVLAGLVYKGCRSERAIAKSLEVLDHLMQIPSNLIVGDDSRLMFTFLANLPRLLSSFDDLSKPPHLLAAAATLASVARARACPDLAAVLGEFAEARILNVDDFLVLSLSAIKASFFPTFELQSLTFLMGLLTNNASWFRIQVLRILGNLLPDINMHKAEVIERGPELISPLLRLLQTDLAPIAMRLLDKFLTLPGVKTSQHHLHMSMTGSRASRAFRKPFEKSQSLYGIPDESGWSVPMPAVRRDALRSNIIAICTAFGDNSPAGSPGLPTSEIEFYKEEHLYGSYFPDRTGTMTSDEAFLAETNMGELVSKLDTLDDFFDSGPESSPSYPFARSSASTPPSSTRHPHQKSPFDSFSSTSSATVGGASSHGTTFSLHRAHKPILPSFRPVSPAAPPRQQSHREPAVMSPSAFSFASRTPSSTSSLLHRPPIHARSVTSPAVNQWTPPDAHPSGVEERERFSDDEVSFGRTSTSDGSFVMHDSVRGIGNLQVAGRPKGSLREGFRTGFSRLTGRDRDRERERRGMGSGRMEVSPEVPKVPEMYRQGPRSADP